MSNGTGFGWEQIKRSLVERGLWTEDGISRKAKARLCRQCGGVIIAGLDHESVAATARCDPTPLNPLGEVNALLAGRRTYSLRFAAGAYSLDMRYAETIAARPAGSQFDVEVLAAHSCGAAETPAHLRGAAMAFGHTTERAVDDQPPY